MNLQQMTFLDEPDTDREKSHVYRGGFPCQPHSCAGKRKASRDERDLWPEFRRVVGEIRPPWVVAENVRGLLSSENGQFFLRVLRDFADLGYDVGWGVTSAAAVGAIHRRERVAIVARNTDSKQPREIGRFLQGAQTESGRTGQIDSDNSCFGSQRRMPAEEQQKTDEQFERVCVHLLQRADAQYICHDCIIYDDWANEPKWYYCPNCGAKMDGDGNG